MLGDVCIDADGGCTGWLGKSFRRSSKADACTDLRLGIKVTVSIKLIGEPHPLVQRTK